MNMRGNRPSSLPIAQFCAKSPALNVGAGRAAAMSSVWHARAAGGDWRDAYNRLTEDEQADIDSWQLPADIILADGVCLRFSEAVKEAECGLDMFANFALKADPACLTAGHCDFYWIVNRVLYVGDLKKSEWTTPDGPRSLQLLCYALALAAKHADEVDYACCGIWHATEGTWEWGETWEVSGDFALSAWERVRAAALNTDGDFATGPHCRNCYSRTKCPAYLVPPDQAHGSLVKYLTGSMTSTDALELKLMLEQVEETAKACKEALKAHVDAHGPIIDEAAGKMWSKGEVMANVMDYASLEALKSEVVAQYRTIVNEKAMLAAHPELASFKKKVPSHHAYSWRNVPKEKK
jgi:hypothetical protein